MTKFPFDVRPETYRWINVVASALMCAFAFGQLVAVSVYLKPLEAEFGWSRADTSLAFGAGTFASGLAGIFMGRLVDRISPRPIVMFGAVMLGLSQLLLSRIEALWQLYLYYLVFIGAFGNGAFLVPLTVNVGSWFDRHRGLALGMLLAGQSLGGAVMPALVRWIMDGGDWRGAYLTMGLITLAVVVPLSWCIRPPPLAAHAPASSLGKNADQYPLSPKRLTATLCTAIVCCCICMSIPIVHLFPMAVEAGIPAAHGALLLSTMMAVSMIGRVGIGKVGDLIGGVRALFIASGVQTVTIFWFTQSTSVSVLMLVTILFALGYGGVIPSYTVIVRELIPARMAGVTTGTVLFFGNLGMALGGYFGGVLYDLSGGYTLSFGIGAVAGAANLLIIASLILAGRVRATSPQPV